MSEINHESILMQVRQGLNRNNIKLWEEPYCSNDDEIEVCTNNYIVMITLQFLYEYNFLPYVSSTLLIY